MLADFDQWERILSSLKGVVFRGSERILTKHILDTLGANQELGQRISMGKKISPIMKRLGWNGPISLRVPDPTSKTGFTSSTGFWRTRGVPRPEAGEAPPDLPSLPGVELELPEALQDGAALGVTWSRTILRKKVDVDNAALLRAQGQAAALMVGSQLRADESRLKRQHDSDVLDRLEKLLRDTERRIPLEPGAIPPRPAPRQRSRKLAALSNVGEPVAVSSDVAVDSGKEAPTAAASGGASSSVSLAVRLPRGRGAGAAARADAAGRSADGIPRRRC